MKMYLADALTHAKTQVLTEKTSVQQSRETEMNLDLQIVLNWFLMLSMLNWKVMRMNREMVEKNLNQQREMIEKNLNQQKEMAEKNLSQQREMVEKNSNQQRETVRKNSSQ